MGSNPTISQNGIRTLNWFGHPGWYKNTHKQTGIWVILSNWPSKCDMEIISENIRNNSKKTFQIISESIFLWRLACYSYVRVEKKDTFWFRCFTNLPVHKHHLCNIEVKPMSWTSFYYVQQCHTRFYWLPLSKLSYVFLEENWRKNPWIKGLAKCLVLMCKFLHFHFSTKAGWHI